MDLVHSFSYYLFSILHASIFALQSLTYISVLNSASLFQGSREASRLRDGRAADEVDPRAGLLPPQLGQQQPCPQRLGRAVKGEHASADARGRRPGQTVAQPTAERRALAAGAAHVLCQPVVVVDTKVGASRREGAAMKLI